MKAQTNVIIAPEIKKKTTTNQQNKYVAEHDYN